MTETLQGEGPYTVFAPNDQAFQKLQQGSQGEQQAGQSQQHGSQGQPQAGQQQSAQSQQQGSQGQQQTGQQSAQSQQQGSQGQQTGQSAQGGDGQMLQQLSSDQLKQVLAHHIVEGKQLSAQDVLGKEQKVQTMSGDQLTVDGTGTMVVLVPAGLTVSRVGDEVFVRREVAAVAQPAVTVSTTGQQGEQQSSQQQSGQQQSGQQQAAAQSGQQGQQQAGQQQAAQSGQQSGQQDQQQAAQSGQQSGQQQSGQAGSQDQGQSMAEQQGLLRAAMVVEPGLQADNGVIHGIDQVLVPQKIEQELMSGQGQSSGQQNQG